jgi:alkyl sulfatase BDS1-like metallo-beta-lactamase superfamily hydrolase
MRIGPQRWAISILVLLAAACGSDETAKEALPPSSERGDSIALPQYSEVVYETGKNLAWTEAAATIDERLVEHSKKMAQRIYRTAGNVYSAVGWGLANMTMIEGTDGIIIVDTSESVENAREVMQAFREITDKPVKAIIYTHNHYDHTMGTEGVLSAAGADSGAIPIYAHEKLMDGLLKQLSVVGEAVGIRSYYTFGNFLDRNPRGSINEGIGPKLVVGTPGFLPPTDTFRDKLEVTIAGIDLVLLYAPSETDDEIVVWIPKVKLLQSAEVIQGESYPNLYTVRGTTYRDPVQWYRTIDRLRELQPEYIVPSHGRPFGGREAVAALLEAYRDAIQYTHDQAVRLINRGSTPDELEAALPGLPAHLAVHPWVQEFYGTVKHSVRNVYVGYLGWFTGDPTTLDPVPPLERARLYVEQMGGRDAVMKAAQAAHERGDEQWCAELLTHVIRVDHHDHEARQLKAAALRELGYGQQNVNWRNFYLTAALELEGEIDYDRYQLSRAAAVLERVPLENLLEKIVTRVDPEKTRDVRMTLAFRLTDTGQSYALEIRRGVVQLHDGAPEKADVTLSGSQDAIRSLLLRRSNFLADWLLDRIEVEGGVRNLKHFFDYFDPLSTEAPKLAVR